MGSGESKALSVAVGIQNEKRLFDRTGRSIVNRPMPFEFPLFGRPRHGGQIIRRDFKAIDDAFQGPRRARQKSENPATPRPSLYGSPKCRKQFAALRG